MLRLVFLEWGQNIILATSSLVRMYIFKCQAVGQVTLVTLTKEFNCIKEIKKKKRLVRLLSRGKYLLIKSDNQSSVSRFHTKVENGLHKIVLQPAHIYHGLCVQTLCTHTIIVFYILRSSQEGSMSKCLLSNVRIQVWILSIHRKSQVW